MPSPFTTGDAQLPTAETGLTADELFGVITAERRRHVLSILRRYDGRVAFDSLSSILEDDDADQWSTPAVTLHHLVLPELERADLVDRDDDDVVLTEGGTSVAAWLELVAAS